VKSDILKAVFWDVTLTIWVSSPWCFEGTKILWNIRNYAPSDTASHLTSMDLQNARTSPPYTNLLSEDMLIDWPWTQQCCKKRVHNMHVHYDLTYLKINIGIPKGGGGGIVVLIIVTIQHKSH
jgi:predicted DsbA family dithiol-disulfide isomerase